MTPRRSAFLLISTLALSGCTVFGVTRHGVVSIENSSTHRIRQAVVVVDQSGSPSSSDDADSTHTLTSIPPGETREFTYDIRGEVNLSVSVELDDGRSLGNAYYVDDTLSLRFHSTQEIVVTDDDVAVNGQSRVIPLPVVPPTPPPPPLNLPPRPRVSENEFARIEHDARDAEAALLRLRRVRRPISGRSTEGGELNGYYDGERLRMLRATWFGEIGQTTRTFTYDPHGMLEFVEQVDEDYVQPIGTTSVIQVATQHGSRAWFAGGRMVRWTMDDGTSMDPASAPYLAHEEVLLREAMDAVAALTSDDVESPAP